MKDFFLNKTEGFFALFLFITLWVYIWLRAIYVPLVHDELVTLHAYMLNGKWLPFEGFLDANNHIFNSALGSFFIKAFGYNSYLIPRFPNVICFPLYYWAIFFILKEIGLKGVSIFGGLALLCFPPYFLEFFGLARGYAIAIAFFSGALWAYFKLVKNNDQKYIWAFVFCSSLSVFSNLTLLFANAGLWLLVAFLFLKKLEIKKMWPLGLALIVFGYMAWYGTQLQASGKLYYGSNDGFFALTVESLVKELFFIGGQKVQWVIKILGSFILLMAIAKAFKEKNLKVLLQPFVAFSFLLAFCLIGIFASNIILNVNFPEDRAALYLFPIFGLMVVSLLSKLPQKFSPIIYGTLILIFTPLLAFNLNLTYSIFWHHDHIHPKFLEEVKNFKATEGYLPTMAGKVIHQSVWGQAAKGKNLVANSLQRYKNNKIDTVSDMQLALLDRSPNLSNYYNQIIFDEVSGLSLLKRKNRLKRTLIESRLISPHKGSDEYFMLWNNLPDSLINRHVLLGISGSIKRNDFPSELIIVTTDETKNGAKAYYEVYGFDIMLNQNQESFEISLYIPNLENPEKAGFYLWNKEKGELEFSELNLNLYKLTNN